MFINTTIELIERVDNVAIIDRRPAVLIDLVKHIVAKQLQQVSIARLAPPPIGVETRALSDEVEFGHQAKQSAVVEFQRQFVFEHVDGVARPIDLVQQARAQQSQNFINRLGKNKQTNKQPNKQRNKETKKQRNKETNKTNKTTTTTKELD